MYWILLYETLYQQLLSKQKENLHDSCINYTFGNANYMYECVVMVSDVICNKRKVTVLGM